MAYGFGSGVRAELGATDYSNYLRGALTGAQMQAQGGAAISAGVQNALAGVGEGIQKFQQNQQEIAAMAGDVKGMTQANPYLLESLDPKQMKVLESIRDGDSVKKKDMLEVYGAISAQNKMAQQQAAAQSQAVQDALRKAQTEEAEARAGALAAPKPLQGRIVSMDEFRSMRDQGLSLSGTPMPNEMVLLDEVGTYSSQPGVVVNTGENIAAKVEAENRINDRDRVGMEIWNDAKAAHPGIEKLTRGLEIIENLDPNTGFFQPVTQLRDKLLNEVFGSKEAMERASATELLNAMQGSQVFELFSEIGLGARGLDTPAERDFMLDVLSGRITMTKKSIKSLLTELRDRKISRVKKHNEKAKGNESYKSFLLERNFGDLPLYDISFLDKPAVVEPVSTGTDLGGGFILN